MTRPELCNNAVDLVNTLQELNALGAGFVSLSDALDLTTPSSRALARVRGLSHTGAESRFNRTVGPSRSGRRRGERERIKSRADPCGPLECRGRLEQPTNSVREMERAPLFFH